MVVGASAGIGRAFAVGAARAGADVTVSARRVELLDGLVAELGAGQVAVVDVADVASRTAWAARLREGPPIDLLLVTTGVADLRPLATTDDDDWSTTLSTNLVGIARLLDEIRPALAPTGVLAATSSETGRRPRHGLVPYAASKVGLEAVLAGLRIEHPGLRVSCVVVGATFPTEFGVGFEDDQLGPALASWERHGVMSEDFMTPEQVAGVLLGLYAAALESPGVNVDEVVLRSPSPIGGPNLPAEPPTRR